MRTIILSMLFLCLTIQTASADWSPESFPVHRQFRVTGGSGFVQIETAIGISNYELPIGASIILSTGTQTSGSSVVLVNNFQEYLSCTELTQAHEAIHRYECTAKQDAGTRAPEIYFTSNGERSNEVVLIPRSTSRPKFSMIIVDNDDTLTVYFDRAINSSMRIQYEVRTASRLVHTGFAPSQYSDTLAINLGDVFRKNGGNGTSFEVKFGLCSSDSNSMSHASCYDFTQQNLKYTGTSVWKSEDSSADIAVSAVSPVETQWTVKDQEQFSLPLSVVNKGPDGANNVNVYILFDHTRVVLTSQHSSCSTKILNPTTTRLTCTIDTFGVNQTLTITPVFRMTASCSTPGEILINVTANAPFYDPVEWNNSITMSVFPKCNQLTTTLVSNPSSARSSSTSSVSSSSQQQSSSNGMKSSNASLSSPIAEKERYIPFHDVPRDAWFRNYINHLVKEGIVSGYKNAEGQLTDYFGPADTVTYAQIAKMAVSVAGLSIVENKEPKNLSAKNQWSSMYIVALEDLGSTVFNDPTLDVNAPAPRGAVVHILYELLPQNTLAEASGEYYTDVSRTTKFAASIESATRDGIVSGDNGKKTFRPRDPVNRAEASKIVSIFMSTFFHGE